MLNTIIDVTDLQSPWTMEPFCHRGLGGLWKKSLSTPAFRFFVRLQGIGDPAKVSKAELNTYLALVKGSDHGRAFVQIMRGSERTHGKQVRYRAVRNRPYPVQAFWHPMTPTMTLASYGEKARIAAGRPAPARCAPASMQPRQRRPRVLADFGTRHRHLPQPRSLLVRGEPPHRRIGSARQPLEPLAPLVIGLFTSRGDARVKGHREFLVAAVSPARPTMALNRTLGAPVTPIEASAAVVSRSCHRPLRRMTSGGAR